MQTTEDVLESLADIEEHVQLLSTAGGSRELIDVVTRYLESWPRERIERLQKIDGGWGTFDAQQRPEPVGSLAEIARISATLGNHCRALKEARIETTPELLELDLFFALARQAAEKFAFGRPRPQSAPDSAAAERRWNGQARLRGAYGNGAAGF